MYCVFLEHLPSDVVQNGGDTECVGAIFAAQATPENSRVSKATASELNQLVVTRYSEISLSRDTQRQTSRPEQCSQRPVGRFLGLVQALTIKDIRDTKI